MDQKQIDQLKQDSAPEVEKSFQDADKAEPIPPSDIVAYNELRSCADLFRLHENGTLDIQPDFQRDVVWKLDDQTRFIDSLVKRLPIPSMCFSLDYTTQEWKVIDGLQRMSSIIHFLSAHRWKLSDLDDIHPLLKGQFNTDLARGDQDQRRLFSTVLDMSIPITVIRCDYSKNSHMQYLFTIFHRLNSGGVRLNNQEIRNCIYSGPFNNLLKDFDKENADWKVVKKSIWGRMDRFRPVEILLRALAFSEQLDDYDGNLAQFLNRYMHEQAQSKVLDIAEIKERLDRMAFFARMTLANTSGKLSLTVVESVLVGIIPNLSKLTDSSQLQAALARMLEAPEFLNAARYAISTEANVKSRMKVALTEFARV